MPSFIEKYPKIKYIIVDGTPNLVMDLRERPLKWIALKLENSHLSEN
jgi:hypothetical protein